MIWSPDTCNCQFDIDVIDDNTINCKSVLRSCTAHGTGTKQNKFESCHSDNTYKNKCIAQIVTDNGVDPLGIIWSYDSNMNLSLSHPDLSKTKINNSVSKVSK